MTVVLIQKLFDFMETDSAIIAALFITHGNPNRCAMVAKRQGE